MLGVSREAGSLFFDLRTEGVVRDDVSEGNGRVALPFERGNDRALDVVELRSCAGELAAARAVGEEPVVQLVRGLDATALDGRGQAVGTCCELCLLPVHRPKP